MKRTARTAAIAARIALQDEKLTSKGNTEGLKRGAKVTTPSSKDGTKIAISKKGSRSKESNYIEEPQKISKPKKSASKKSKIESASQDDGKSPYFSLNNESLTPRIKLTREFYNQDCIPLCKALLGTVLARKLPETGEIVRGTIVETEAYAGQDDKASVTYLGRRTPKMEALFMDPGTAYVYFTMGMYHCFNISTKGEGSACLLRAVEPLEDYEIMHYLRKPIRKKESTSKSGSKVQDKLEVDKQQSGKRLKTYELANGPSKLCMAFGIQRDNCDKVDMANSDELWLEYSQEKKFRNREFEIEITKRIGIDSAPPESRDRPLRFLIRDSFAVSKAKVSEIKKRLGSLSNSQN